MIRDFFRVLEVDLSQKKARLHKIDGRDEFIGGSGLCALLFSRFGKVNEPWDDPMQPLIFAIGPLTGYFPLMSKTICAFKSPYNNQYTESHGGGRSALSLRFSDLDAFVITGCSSEPVVVAIGSNDVEFVKADFLWGLDVIQTGKIVRKMFHRAKGHRSILRIGPAGERKSAISCINVDTYRHFGRLGAGAVMGHKKLKAIVIQGDASFPLPETRSYKKAYKEVFEDIIGSGMMKKYHDLGTPANIKRLNDLKSLPWRNLLSTSDNEIEKISGEVFADDHLLRNLACSGCPIGCIHVGYFREKFMKDHRYFFEQVAYDYEPIFATGSMLGITKPAEILKLIFKSDEMGLDVISAGVALAWATEAFKREIISIRETIVPLNFGDSKGYLEAMEYLAKAQNDFYASLSKGTLYAASIYGGQEFACVLGQEMAGYATGELFFVAQSLGFRHSHLDVGAYSYEQKYDDKDLDKHIDFLLKDEVKRVFLNCMVACLFSRGVYTTERLKRCLESTGYNNIAENIEALSEKIRKDRWKLRFSSGFNPDDISIPKRFYKVVSWKGPVDKGYLERLKKEYGRRLKRLVLNE